MNTFWLLWGAGAVALIGYGVACTLIERKQARKKEAQRTAIFLPEHQEYKDIYINAIVGIEREWAERQRA